MRTGGLYPWGPEVQIYDVKLFSSSVHLPYCKVKPKLIISKNAKMETFGLTSKCKRAPEMPSLLLYEGQPVMFMTSRYHPASRLDVKLIKPCRSVHNAQTNNHIDIIIFSYL